MKATGKILVAALVAASMTGCCLTNSCLSNCWRAQPFPGAQCTADCMSQQIRPPSEWCWGNCQLDDEGQVAGAGPQWSQLGPPVVSMR